MIQSEFNQYQTLLNGLPPRITAAIMEVHTKTGCPMELVILLAISAMSSALHGFALRTPDGCLMPLSLYCMGIGPPVCGKSAAMREFFKWLRKFDSHLAERRASSPALKDHPALRDIIQLDATWSSLLEALHGTGNALTIADDDCIDLLKSSIMKRRGALSRVFDGAVKESLIRRDHNPLVAYLPSVGICCLTQPEIYTEHLISTRHLDRKSGLAPRFLYAHTLEGLGSLQISSLPTPHLDEIGLLTTWFLEQRLQRTLIGQTERIELRLSAEAESYWAELKKEIKVRMTDDFIHVRDSAARATEKTWRIAAILHCFNSPSLPATPFDPLLPIPAIDQNTIYAAWRIVEWSMFQFFKVFPPPVLKPPKPSRVQERQFEESRVAKMHLYNHLRRVGGDTIMWSVAQELSWLSAHKFKTVVAHLKSKQQVEVLEARDPILKFSSQFFAEMGYTSSIEANVQGIAQF